MTFRLAGACAIVVAALVVAASARQAAVGDREYQAALHKEMVDRDPKAAIELYRPLAKSADRALAAQAALRMAECYQKLGQDSEAQKMYALLVRELADRPEAVEARKRLAAAGSASPSKRRVWTQPEGVSVVNVSPNGRYALLQTGVGVRPDGLLGFSVGGAKAPFPLGLHDLTTGQNRPLNQLDADEAKGVLGGMAAWSKDSEHVAYPWTIPGSPGNGARCQLRVADLSEEGPGADRVVLENPEIKEISAYDWTPDGRIAVTLGRVDGTRQIALVPALGGPFRALKTLDWRGAGSLTLSPDGRFLAFSLPASDSIQTHVSVLATDGTRDVPVIRSPEDDSPLGWSRDGKELFFVRKRGQSDELMAVAFTEKGAPAEPSFRGNLGLLNGAATLTLSGALFVHEQPRWTSTLLTASFDFAAGMLTTNLTGGESLLGASAGDELTTAVVFSPDARFVAYPAPGPPFK